MFTLGNLLFQDVLIIRQIFSPGSEYLPSSEKQFASLAKNTDCEVSFQEALFFCIIYFCSIPLFEYCANIPQPGGTVGDEAAGL
jgi:hypothetical protein